MVMYESGKTLVRPMQSLPGAAASRLAALAMLALLIACADGPETAGPTAAADGVSCPSWKIATGSCQTPYTCVADNPCSAAAPRSGCGCGGTIISVAAGCPKQAYGWTHDGLKWLANKAPEGVLPCDPDLPAPAHLDVVVQLTGIPGEDGRPVSAAVKDAWQSTYGKPAQAKSAAGSATLLVPAGWRTEVDIAELELRIAELPATATCANGVDLAWTVTASHDFDLRDFEIEVAVDANTGAVVCR